MLVICLRKKGSNKRAALKNVFVNKADQDQVALSCLRMKSRYEISDHTQVELVQYARAAASNMF